MIDKEITRVLHLDHSREAGGAEIALSRLIPSAQGLWDARISVPRSGRAKTGGQNASSDPFSHLSEFLCEIGPSQRPGATKASGYQQVAFAIALLRQARALANSRAWAGADLVHANTTRAGLYGTVAATIHPKPLVVHLRDRIEVQSIGRIAFETFTRLVLPRARGIVANSTSTLQTALPHIRSSTKIKVIPSSIGITTGGTPKARMFTNQSDLNVGMVARIDPWKGQHLLLEAVAQMESPSVRVHLAGGAAFGNEQYLEDLRNLAVQLGISGQVKFHDHVENVPDFILEMDICVQCSTRPEPLGQNVLQYLALGKCVIASDAGGPPEWIEDKVNGRLFKENDVNQLASVLSELSNHPNLRQEYSAAAKSYRPVPSDAQIAEMHCDLFHEIL